MEYCTVNECTEIIVMRYARELGYTVITLKQRKIGHLPVPWAHYVKFQQSGSPEENLSHL